ncbi:MAG: GNAT family N-acetyltransferase [Rhodospirillales bacterium 12-71-4]|nr:MAG: GNAT family N-acetyltransferase [Rhodospirillales bacterium 12-71-4]
MRTPSSRRYSTRRPTRTAGFASCWRPRHRGSECRRAQRPGAARRQARPGEWLRRRARANQAAGASRTFVVCRAGFVVGFYCLAAGAVAVTAAPGRVKRNMPDPIPMAMLGRLAVDRSLHGKGIGRALLRDAVLRVLQASEVLAVRGVLVQALSDDAQQFYQACGFTPSPIDPMTLMATMTDLKAALG